jgi:alkylation response protein AidB-like acyl-CoA dehydrogenase
LDFNEVFLTDVRVPAENLVGPLNGGWKVANGSLGHERTMMWLQFANRLGQTLESYRPCGALHRDAYASIAMDYQALRLMGSAALARAARGDADVAGLSVLKVFGSEAEQNAYRQVLEATGVDALADPAMSAPYNPYSPGQFTAGWFTRYIGSFAGTIAGGTSEIQRNIIAQHVLKLPTR